MGRLRGDELERAENGNDAMIGLLRTASRLAIDAVFPPRCAGCGKFGAFLCETCEEALTPAAGTRCPACWEPSRESETCARCRKDRPSFEGLRAPYVFQGAVRELVHAMKYNYQSSRAPTAASLLNRYLSANPLPVDILVPVPLHPRRERLRGYNQSALMARELGKTMRLPVVEHALMRSRNTPSQAGSARSEERKRNVKDAFGFRGAPLSGRQALLIDDVATTGATLDACARVLLDNGAASVWALALARED